MKILLINGSARQLSNTQKLTNLISQADFPANAELTIYDLSVNQLPIYTGEEEQYELPQVSMLCELAEEADGFIICTPEYHNSMSGALKNLLDYLGADQLNQKIVQIFAVSGGGKGGINALNHLRLVMRGVGAMVVPQQHVVDADQLDAEGNFVSERNRSIIQQQLDEFCYIMSRMTASEVTDLTVEA